MKRLWIGTIILVLLLGAGIGTTVFAVRSQGNISQELANASEAALRGKWEEACTFSLNAKKQWESLRHGTAAIADHEPMEDVDEDELVIMRIEQDKDGNDFYSTIDSDKELNEVFEKYLEIADADEDEE